MKLEHLTVTGMSCGGCVSRVTEALKGLPGVGGVEITLKTGTVDVTYDDRLVRPAQMSAAVEKAGYGVGTPTAGVQPKGCCC